MKIVLGRSWERKAAGGRNFQGLPALAVTTRLKREAKEPGTDSAPGRLPALPFSRGGEVGRERLAPEPANAPAAGFGRLDSQTRASGERQAGGGGGRRLPGGIPELAKALLQPSLARACAPRRQGRRFPRAQESSKGPHREAGQTGRPPIPKREEPGDGLSENPQSATAQPREAVRPDPASSSAGGSDVFIGQMRGGGSDRRRTSLSPALLPDQTRQGLRGASRSPAWARQGREAPGRPACSRPTPGVAKGAPNFGALPAEVRRESTPSPGISSPLPPSHPPHGQACCWAPWLSLLRCFAAAAAAGLIRG